MGDDGGIVVYRLAGVFWGVGVSIHGSVLMSPCQMEVYKNANQAARQTAHISLVLGWRSVLQLARLSHSVS